MKRTYYVCLVKAKCQNTTGKSPIYLSRVINIPGFQYELDTNLEPEEELYENLLIQLKAEELKKYSYSQMDNGLPVRPSELKTIREAEQIQDIYHKMYNAYEVSITIIKEIYISNSIETKILINEQYHFDIDQ